ncbi:putative armadillo-like helical, pumilio domain-containing protein [Helianthus debilis subsp. tardiflorus]
MDDPRRTHKFLANGYPFQSVFAPIDVDRSLPEMFSMLNLSPEGRRSIPSGYSGAGEGLGQSNLGFNRFLSYDHEQQNLFSSGFDFGFDYGFDFDRMGCLESKKVFYSHPQFKIDDYEKQNVCCSSSSFYNNNNNNNKNNTNNQNVGFMSVWSLRGGICKMAKDQNGCRILQAMLERSTMEEVEIVLCEVVSFVADLMKDQFGNYLVQKLVTMCNDGQKLRLVLSLIETPTDIILVCMNPHGYAFFFLKFILDRTNSSVTNGILFDGLCFVGDLFDRTRAVQALLESLNPNQVRLVVKALCRGAATLAVDPNGHHVIQYCLINFHSDINKVLCARVLFFV